MNANITALNKNKNNNKKNKNDTTKYAKSNSNLKKEVGIISEQNANQKHTGGEVVSSPARNANMNLKSTNYDVDADEDECTDENDENLFIKEFPKINFKTSTSAATKNDLNATSKN